MMVDLLSERLSRRRSEWNGQISNFPQNLEQKMREKVNENKMQKTTNVSCPNNLPRSVDRNEGVAGWKVGCCVDAVM